MIHYIREKECSIQRVKKFEEFSGISIDVDSIISNSRFQTITVTDITKMVFNNERVRSMSFVKRYIDQASTQSEAMARFKRDLFGKVVHVMSKVIILSWIQLLKLFIKLVVLQSFPAGSWTTFQMK